MSWRCLLQQCFACVCQAETGHEVRQRRAVLLKRPKAAKSLHLFATGLLPRSRPGGVFTAAACWRVADVLFCRSESAVQSKRTCFVQACLLNAGSLLHETTASNEPEQTRKDSRKATRTGVLGVLAESKAVGVRVVLRLYPFCFKSKDSSHGTTS